MVDYDNYQYYIFLKHQKKIRVRVLRFRESASEKIKHVHRA